MYWCVHTHVYIRIYVHKLVYMYQFTYTHIYKLPQFKVTLKINFNNKKINHTSRLASFPKDCRREFFKCQVHSNCYDKKFYMDYLF